MENYYDSLNEEVKQYFKILSPEFPKWLLDYIHTPEMQRIKHISMHCGCDYSKLFNVRYWYSNLDHSVGVALIIWHFTKDKKQTLSGLFHDIATPTFKHCIDFMNGDSINQESTEERTYEIIHNSKAIMELLKRDGITLEEVWDYKLYPIADNDTPQLSADRFEYTFSSGLSFCRVFELDEIQKIYDDIVILKNENNIDELSFQNIEICELFIEKASKLWYQWTCDEDRTVMQFIADMCKSMNNAGYLTIDDLYQCTEKEIIERIIHCPDAYLGNCFKQFMNETKVFKSNEKINGKYACNVMAKTRYMNPLVKKQRITNVSKKINQIITDYLNTPKGGYWTCFDFDFQPYQ